MTDRPRAEAVVLAVEALLHGKDYHRTINSILAGLADRPKPGAKREAREACKDLLDTIKTLKMAVYLLKPPPLVASEMQETHHVSGTPPRAPDH